jgi:hypothetical protein
VRPGTTPIRYFPFCSHEHFSPDALLQQAVATERAGWTDHH